MSVYIDGWHFGDGVSKSCFRDAWERTLCKSKAVDEQGVPRIPLKEAFSAVIGSRNSRPYRDMPFLVRRPVGQKRRLCVVIYLIYCLTEGEGPY
jgi:hypothetical protein